MNLKRPKLPGVLLLSLFMVLPLSSAYAGKIYKWVDKDGNVQFSNTPGPDQDASAHIGEARKGTGSPKSSKVKSSLKGKWYGTVYGKSYMLQFRGNRMYWDITTKHKGSVNRIFEARWQELDGDIKVTYTKHYHKASMNGKDEVIKVISRNEAGLKLLFPDKRVYDLVKSVSYRRLELEEKKLIGSWIRKTDGAEIKFKSGSFTVKGEIENRRGKVITESGDWTASNGVLSFTYTSGLETQGRHGTTDEFDILLSDEKQLILADRKTKKQVVYNRKIAK